MKYLKRWYNLKYRDKNIFYQFKLINVSKLPHVYSKSMQVCDLDREIENISDHNLLN